MTTSSSRYFPKTSGTTGTATAANSNRIWDVAIGKRRMLHARINPLVEEKSHDFGPTVPTRVEEA